MTQRFIFPKFTPLEEGKLLFAVSSLTTAIWQILNEHLNKKLNQ